MKNDAGDPYEIRTEGLKISVMTATKVELFAVGVALYRGRKLKRI